MSRERITRRMIELLREGALNGSERDVGLDEPLGETGLGLDSLALVQFLVAVEKEFKTRIPMEVWSRADKVPLREFTELVVASGFSE